MITPAAVNGAPTQTASSAPATAGPPVARSAVPDGPAAWILAASVAAMTTRRLPDPVLIALGALAGVVLVAR